MFSLLFVLFLGLQTADLGITLHLINSHNYYEVNPIVRPSPIVVKTSVTAVTSVIFFKYRNKHPKLVKFGLIAANSILTFAVIHNLRE